MAKKSIDGATLDQFGGGNVIRISTNSAGLVRQRHAISLCVSNTPAGAATSARIRISVLAAPSDVLGLLEI